MEIAGRALLTSATLGSLGLNQSEPPSEPKKPTPKLPRGPGVFSPEYRAKLLQLDEGHHPKVADLAIAAEWYVRAMSVNDLSKGRCLAITGSPGCGKTKVARAIYRFARSFGADILLEHKAPHWATQWIDWPTIAEADDESDFEEGLRKISEATFVVIDDVGSETDRFKSGLPASRLRRVLTLLERERWAVITSNLTRSQLFDLYDVRVADRFRAYQWMELGDVPSYRSKLV